MKPTLREQDIVIVKKCPINDLKEGDIVTFYKNEEIISHRIVKINKNVEGITLTTKGDNNEVEDNFNVNTEEIIGKVILKIRGIGKIVIFIQNEKGFLSSIILITIIFIMINISDKKKSNRKTKRKKYEIKRLRDNYSL